MADLASVKNRLLRLHVPTLVIKNAIALYGVQAGRKLIPLASIPYLARALGPEAWGEVAFTTAMAELIAVFVEFGFGLSATRAIASYRDDRERRGQITTGVLCVQLILAAIGVTVAVIASRFIPLLRERPELLACGLVYAVAQGFSPIWFFQGMERIRLASAIEMAGKLTALGGYFVFVHGPKDVWRTLIIQALSPWALVAIGVPLALASGASRPRWSVIKSVFSEGWNMFVFRSTESLYGVANAFLLGLYTTPTIVGYFGAAEKINKATGGLLNPIRDSLYPRISNLVGVNDKEAARLAKIGTAVAVGAGLLLSVTIFIFAGPVIKILMGGRFEPAVSVLKILSPLALLVGITGSSGQFWLLPRKKDRAVLRVVFQGAFVNLTLSFILAPRFGHIGMAWAVLVSESVVAGALLWNVVQMLRSKPDISTPPASSLLEPMMQDAVGENE